MNRAEVRQEPKVDFDDLPSSEPVRRSSSLVLGSIEMLQRQREMRQIQAERLGDVVGQLTIEFKPTTELAEA